MHTHECNISKPFCRDPNALETLKSFENCMNWACSTNFESRDVFEAKLGVFSQVNILYVLFSLFVFCFFETL